jgi:hypothetical protein
MTRPQRASRAIEAWLSNDPSSMREPMDTLADIFADLFHWTDQAGISIDDTLWIARERYEGDKQNGG